MAEIKKFTETDIEFQEVTRLFNLVSHDDKEHVDDMKEGWAVRDKSLQRERFLLYDDDTVLGFLGYAQGRDVNHQNCYFNIYLDPEYNGNGYRKLLYDRMLQDIATFDCNRLYADIYEHPNYEQFKKFLLENKFYVGLKIREYSLDIESVDLAEYSSLLEKLDSKGIKFYDAKNEMNNFPNHYNKLEELGWEYGEDFPMPEGIVHTRQPFEQFMKFQKLFEEKRYGIEIVAVDGKKYVGSTDIHVLPKSDPHKAWTGSLGVLREYRRQGIATALKVKAFEKLREKGIKQVRTDNEENNPMYKINVALGFTPEPYCYDYQREL
jgi:GNAT superfamily N-acetyltransferase